MLKISMKPVTELVFDENNARKHSETNMNSIKFSLAKFGQRKPIVISTDGVVVAGNGTLQAAKEMGWEKIATVTIPEDWDEATIKAFAIADNRTAELAEWNQEVLASQLLEIKDDGFEIQELDFEPKDLPSFEPTDELERLDEKQPKFCPECGHDITNY